MNTVVKSKKVGWVGHVPHWGRRKMNMGIQWGNLKERDQEDVIEVDCKQI